MFKKINDIKIQTIKVPKIDEKNIVGYDMFPEIYGNIFISAKKMSGKSTVIYNIIKNCADKNSVVVVFCNTYRNDANWITIRKYLDDKKIPNLFYDSIHDGAVNNLSNLVNLMSAEDEPEDEKEPESCLSFNEKEIRIKVRKPKKISQKYLIIMDDISSELKDPNVSILLKQNRHYKSKVIISSQYINDIAPQCRRQMQYYLLFSGINEQKLEELFDNADLNIDFEQFVYLYKLATAGQYNFFYIGTNGDYRRNFNEKILF
jgi:hypothetical protein